MSWNDERVETLKRGVAQGLSASAIARMVGGITRNAVIGKVHRLGLNLHAGTSPAQRLAQRAGQRRGKIETLRKMRKVLVERGLAKETGENVGRKHRQQQAEFVRATAAADATPPQALMLSLIDLEPQHCRWPIGEPGKPGFGFCGCQKAPVGSYCTHHAKMSVREAYVSPDAGVWGPDMRKRFAAA